MLVPFSAILWPCLAGVSPVPGALKCPSMEERPPVVVVEDLESADERRPQFFCSSVYVPLTACVLVQL